MERKLLGYQKLIRLNLMRDDTQWCCDCINIHHHMLTPPPEHDFLRAVPNDLDHYFMPGSVESITVHWHLTEELTKMVKRLLAPGGKIYEFPETAD